MSVHKWLADYRRHGIVFPLRALSEPELQEARTNYMHLCSPGQVVVEGSRRIFGHLLHPWVAQLVTHPLILDAVRTIIGPNVLVWVSEFNAKAPHTPSFFSWHQDLYYWRHQFEDLRNIPIVTTWLALTDANQANGCMRVVPGSHGRLARHIEKPCEKNLLTRSQEIDRPIDERSAMPVSLVAGEFSIHHPLLFHASGPNFSGHPRIGLVTRYIAPEVAPPVRPAYSWLVSGEDIHGNWDHVAPLNVSSGIELKDKCIQSIQNATGSRFK